MFNNFIMNKKICFALIHEKKFDFFQEGQTSKCHRFKKLQQRGVTCFLETYFKPKYMTIIPKYKVMSPFFFVTKLRNFSII